MRSPALAEQAVAAPPPFVESLDLLDEHLVDEFTTWGRDPFDVLAELEEELGHPLNYR